MMVMPQTCHALSRRVVAYARYCGVLVSDCLPEWVGSPKPTIPRAKKHALHFAGKAVQLCRGTGIEVGSLHKRLPLIANVLYLDVQKTAELRELYRNDPRVAEIGQVQLVANGGKYPFFDDGAFDFVASSHVLEHTPNPPRQIHEWLRVVRTGGIVYMIVPDKRYCFDRRRELTMLEHFITEFNQDTTLIGLDHYRDYIANTNGEDGLLKDTSEEFIELWHQQQRSIHAHTFTADSLREFLDYFADKLLFQVIHFEADGLNIHAALQKV